MKLFAFVAIFGFLCACDCSTVRDVRALKRLKEKNEPTVPGAGSAKRHQHSNEPFDESELSEPAHPPLPSEESQMQAKQAFKKFILDNWIVSHDSKKRLDSMYVYSVLEELRLIKIHHHMNASHPWHLRPQPVHPLANYAHFFKFQRFAKKWVETPISRSGISDAHEREYMEDLAMGEQALVPFLNKVFDLFFENPIMSRFSGRIIQKYGEDTSEWAQALETHLSRQLPADECREMAGLQNFIRDTIHLTFVFDGLTRAMYENPSTLLAEINEYYLGLLSKDQINFEQMGAFFLVKLPSVLAPIRAFVDAMTTPEQKAKLPNTFPKGLFESIRDFVSSRMSSSRRQSPPASSNGPEMEEEQSMYSLLAKASQLEEDEEGAREAFLMGMAKSMISDDPTQALRQNILEACVALIYMFSKSSGLLPQEDVTVAIGGHKFELGKLPPGTLAGAVIASDAYMGGFDCNSKNLKCMGIFKQGKFTFSNSLDWQHIYSAWNLGFTSGILDTGMWWSKLIPPAVLEDESGESYIVRRTIALYLALFRNAMRNTKKQAGELSCSQRFTLGFPVADQHMIGQEVWRYASEYAKTHWAALDDACGDDSIFDSKPPCALEKMRNNLKWLRRIDVVI